MALNSTQGGADSYGSSDEANRGLEYSVKNTESSSTYEATVEDVHRQTLEFLDAIPENQRQKDVGIYILRGGQPSDMLAHFVEQSVFGDAFQNSPEELQKLYGPFDAQSEYLVGINHKEKMPIAALRMIQYSNQEFPAMRDLQQEWGVDTEQAYQRFAINRQKTSEIGTLAVMKGYRGLGLEQNATGPLYYGLHKLSLMRNLENWVGVLDSRVFNYLKWIGLDLHNMANPQPYHGSATSVPFYARVKDIAPHLKEMRPNFYRILVEGQGLDAFDLPAELKPDNP